MITLKDPTLGQAFALRRSFALEVALTSAEFIRASDPQDVAHDLAMGLNKLRRVARSPLRISNDQWEELTYAIHGACLVADHHLPAKIDRGRLRRGLKAAAALVNFMALTPEERRARSRYVRDAFDDTLVCECDMTALSVEIDRTRRVEREREANRTAVVVPFAAPQASRCNEESFNADL